MYLPPPSPTLSAAMIVRNEEAGLGAALASLGKLSTLDEIVVVDTGSTDTTCDIARAMGARLFHEPWREDFSWHRNHVQGLCRNDWIFVLDGDEILEDAAGLDDVVQNAPAQGALLEVECRGAGGAVERLWSVRLYDRRVGQWRFPVHNQLLGVERAVRVGARVLAFYDGDFLPSVERRLPRLLRAAADEPSELHHPLCIARALRQLSRFEECLPWAERTLSLGGEAPASGPAHVYKVEALLALGRNTEAQAALTLALAHHPLPDLYFYQMLLSMRAWHDASTRPRGPWALIPSHSAPLAARLPEAVALLGLPLELGGLEGPSDRAEMRRGVGDPGL